ARTERARLLPQRNLRQPAPYRDAEAVEQALAALEKSSPAGEETLLLRVLDRSRKGRPREAEAALGEVRSKLPADQAPLALARGYELLGQAAEAERAYRAA